MSSQVPELPKNDGLQESTTQQVQRAWSNGGAQFLFYALTIASWPFLFIGGIGLASTIVPFLLTNTDRMTDEQIWPMLSRLLLGVVLAGALLGIGGLLRLGAEKVAERYLRPVP